MLHMFNKDRSYVNNVYAASQVLFQRGILYTFLTMQDISSTLPVHFL